jgi:hypothetical protein
MELAAAAARAAAARAFAVAARAAVASDAILASDSDAATRTVLAFAVVTSAADAFWSAVSDDATRWEEGVAASGIAGSPLWPNDQPVKLRSMWQEVKAALHAEKQDWQLWTSWFDDRFEGRAREEERELAYVRIEEALWDQGAAIVNAEIKRLVDAHKAPTQSLPVLPEPSNEVANAGSPNRVSAAKTAIALSRRPVFKRLFLLQP